MHNYIIRTSKYNIMQNAHFMQTLKKYYIRSCKKKRSEFLQDQVDINIVGSLSPFLLQLVLVSSEQLFLSVDDLC